MADETEEEQWLYGDSGDVLQEKPVNGTEPAEEPAESTEQDQPEVPPPEQEVPQEEEKEPEEPPNESMSEAPPEPDGEQPSQEGEQEAGEQTEKVAAEEGEEEDDEDDDDDDSDDNVQVTIGDIKAAPQPYTIKRNAALAPGVDKHKGKFSIEEFESIGTINGAPAHEFSIDALEEKPWRKPGADITDYFNYGFNEDTWRAYCERQKNMRIHESGVGLGGLGMGVNVRSNNQVVANAVLPDIAKKAGPPPTARRSGVIDVIGSASVASRRTDSPPKENIIQVMTADKRDYGRKTYDLSVPPPGFEGPPSGPPIPSVVGYPGGPYPPDFYPPEMDPYYSGPFDSGPPPWGSMPPVRSSRRRRESSPLYHRYSPYRSSPRHSRDSLPKEMHPDAMSMKSQDSMEMSTGSKERERDRDRHKDRHRHRSRSRSTDRDRRSRKHKSRSRSPSHRSHKKKKSKRSEKSRDRSRDRDSSD